MSEQDLIAIGRLMELRSTLFRYIKAALAEDGHCKSYEGAFDIRLPNYFESQPPLRPRSCRLTLHCYVIGPNRHYEWEGNTLTECVDKAEKEMNKWFRDYDTVTS